MRSSEVVDCDEVICAGWGEPGGQWTEWGWRNEEGSWFHRQGDAYVKERLVICNEEDTDGRARVTRDEERVLPVDWTEIRLCLNFVGEWQEFIFNAFIYLEPVQRSEDGCDMRRFRSFNHSTCKTVLDLLEAVYLRLRKIVHCVQKKTPTHIFFHISMSDV